MKKLTLSLATVLAALACSVSLAQLPPHQMYLDRSAIVQPGDCLRLEAPRPSLGTVGVDSQIPCSPSFLTSAYTNATTSYTAVLALPQTAASTTVRGECTLTWEDSSTSGTVTFAAQLSGVPTDLWVTANPTSGAFVAPTFTTITSTTQTAITGALVTTTANAPYQLYLSFTVQNALVPTTLTISAESNNASYTVTVEPGSSCAWLP